MESVTFFGVRALNRVSYMREDHDFIKSCLLHEDTTFVPFVDGEGLVREKAGMLYTFCRRDDTVWDDILKRFVQEGKLDTLEGSDPFSGFNLTFLGLFEGQGSFSYDRNSTRLQGRPFFGVDFCVRDGCWLKQQPNWSRLHVMDLQSVGVVKLRFRDSLNLSNLEGSLYSHARAYIDWLSKFKFCPNCGSRIFAIHGGTKLQCSNSDTSVPCSVRDAHVNNVCFPRTDTSIIVAIANKDYSKMCLTSSRRRISQDLMMYTTVAGFIEPAETIETACAREISEEVGLTAHVKNIHIVSSQPWPNPANLMIGCVATIDFNGHDEIISLDNDQELADAQWFDTEEVAQAIDKYNNDRDNDSFFVEFRKEHNMMMPGRTTIAFELISHVCNHYRKMAKH